MTAIQDLVAKLKEQVKEMIRNRPDLNYMEIATKNKVGLDFVQKQAHELKEDENFSRGRGWQKVPRN